MMYAAAGAWCHPDYTWHVVHVDALEFCVILWLQLTMYRLPKATSRFYVDVALYEAMFGDAPHVAVDFRSVSLQWLAACCFRSSRQLLLLHNLAKHTQLHP
jgi:hypothetical protein